MSDGVFHIEPQSSVSLGEETIVPQSHNLNSMKLSENVRLVDGNEYKSRCGIDSRSNVLETMSQRTSLVKTYQQYSKLID
jgi:hypothetical protein